MSRKKFKIDLNKIENFAYALQTASLEIKPRLEAALKKWASETKADYDSKSGHARLLGKDSFYQVEEAYSVNGLHVSVGHESFVAKFLEVGTKPHEIVRKSRNGKSYVSAKVSGIKGNRPLSKVFNRRRKEIPNIIHEEIEKILKER